MVKNKYNILIIYMKDVNITLLNSVCGKWTRLSRILKYPCYWYWSMMMFDAVTIQESISQLLEHPYIEEATTTCN